LNADRAHPLASPVRHRWRAFAFAVLALASLPAMTQSSGDRTLQVEAAFLVNFVRYTQWPPERFGGPAAPYVVAVVGSEDAAATVRAVATAAGSIQGRRIAVVRIDDRVATPAQRETLRRRLGDSHLVFLPDADDSVSRNVLRAAQGLPLLTVGDSEDFTMRGGMLGLVRAGSHLVFEANPRAIQDARVMVSAKVLKLARIVGSGAP
jgi:hypothetical protein